MFPTGESFSTSFSFNLNFDSVLNSFRMLLECVAYGLEELEKGTPRRPQIKIVIKYVKGEGDSVMSCHNILKLDLI